MSTQAGVACCVVNEMILADAADGTTTWMKQRAFVCAQVTGGDALGGAIMRWTLLVVLVAGLLMIPIAAPAGAPEYAPIAGEWTTTDCPQNTDSNGTECASTEWGDESTITMTITAGPNPMIFIHDDYDAECDGGSLNGIGFAWYEVDQPTVRTLNGDIFFARCRTGGPLADSRWTTVAELPFYWDPGSDQIWTDTFWDTDNELGFVWTR